MKTKEFQQKFYNGREQSVWKRDGKTSKTLHEFNMILNNMSHTDKIGHLFIVDIKFQVKNKKNFACCLMKSTHQYLKKS